MDTDLFGVVESEVDSFFVLTCSTLLQKVGTQFIHVEEVVSNEFDLVECKEIHPLASCKIFFRYGTTLEHALVYKEGGLLEGVLSARLSLLLISNQFNKDENRTDYCCRYSCFLDSILGTIICNDFKHGSIKRYISFKMSRSKKGNPFF